MKITIIGTGYVGLVAGACLADMGNSVICVDNNEDKIKLLKNNQIPIYEPGLDEIIKNNINEHRLEFTSDLDYGVKSSKVCFIAVGTPQDKDGSADLHYVLDVAELIAKSMNGYKVIVDKSTVPVGTAEKVESIIKRNTTHPFDVVSNPEFLKQGNAVTDFLYPDRIIIGSNSEKATKIMQDIYAPYLRTSNRIILMDVKSAEMTKYAANSFLATKISFMNEIANLCEVLGANPELVRLGIATDSRIGSKFLFPGLGYGGSCFPKDVKALIRTGLDNNCEMSLISAVDKINQDQRKFFIKKIIDKFGEDLTGKTFGVWGLAFKPKTDDMREAPSVTIINSILERGGSVKAYDPKSIQAAKSIFGDKIKYCDNSYDALRDCDAMLLITEWNEFRHPNFDDMKLFLKNPIIFDGRNIYNQKLMEDLGFEYYYLGKRVIPA